MSRPSPILDIRFDAWSPETTTTDTWSSQMNSQDQLTIRRRRKLSSLFKYEMVVVFQPQRQPLVLLVPRLLPQHRQQVPPQPQALRPQLPPQQHPRVQQPQRQPLVLLVLRLLPQHRQQVPPQAQALPTTATTTTNNLPAQCSSYTTITDSTRNIAYSSSSTCDTSLFSSTPTWVKFSGGAGSRIVTSASSVSVCGTDAPGWYNGAMPPVGVSNTGTVCYNWAGNNCNWSNNVQVTNCNGFYVYALIAPPTCNLRYCTT
ncbi:unnamed protein product [Didymodactylos carnosus]|uniref:UMOD/GP2/OIT3-like D8C domain-containing protein n=1 Tax=Didymodactylos carnosus TaxID=1234261 RepID=A0A815WBY5_9BILA|nr:unnamed protein product [Didymodactylos carnosus]CAF4403947.1 unnamed protein product [Didymodactylos carnosus]